MPITESFALYHALASRHVPVRFIGIPGAHHMPQDPVHRELYYRAIEDWVVARMQPSNRVGSARVRSHGPTLDAPLTDPEQ